MNDRDYQNVMEFKNVKGKALIPSNQNAIQFTDQCNGKVIALKDVTKRDLSFHRAYMGLLLFIWLHLPEQFKAAVPQKHFYKWLKHLEGKYNVLFEFKDGTKLVEYKSISFGRMSQEKFKAYVMNQLPYIYENVIRKMYDQEAADITIEIIEDKWKDYFELIYS